MQSQSLTLDLTTSIFHSYEWKGIHSGPSFSVSALASAPHGPDMWAQKSFCGASGDWGLDRGTRRRIITGGVVGEDFQCVSSHPGLHVTTSFHICSLPGIELF